MPGSFSGHWTNSRAVSANIINHICLIVLIVDPDKYILTSRSEVHIVSLLFMLYEVVFHAAKHPQPGGKALISPPWLGPGPI